MRNYKIRARRFWLGHNSPAKITREDVMDPATGQTYEGTRAYCLDVIKHMDNTTYHLAHNEAGRADYYISRID